MWWQVFVILATWEPEAGESLEPRSRGCREPRSCHCTPTWATRVRLSQKKFSQNLAHIQSLRSVSHYYNIVTVLKLHNWSTVTNQKAVTSILFFSVNEIIQPFFSYFLWIRPFTNKNLTLNCHFLDCCMYRMLKAVIVQYIVLVIRDSYSGISLKYRNLI